MLVVPASSSVVALDVWVGGREGRTFVEVRARGVVVVATFPWGA